MHVMFICFSFFTFERNGRAKFIFLTYCSYGRLAHNCDVVATVVGIRSSIIRIASLQIHAVGIRAHRPMRGCYYQCGYSY